MSRLEVEKTPSMRLPNVEAPLLRSKPEAFALMLPPMASSARRVKILRVLFISVGLCKKLSGGTIVSLAAHLLRQTPGRFCSLRAVILIKVYPYYDSNFICLKCSKRDICGLYSRIFFKIFATLSQFD